MKQILLISSVFLLISTTSYSQTQTLRLSTYYPAPYGRYQQITVGDRVLIVPKAAEPATCQNGEIYVDGTEGTKLCQGGNWVPMGGFSTGTNGSGVPIVFNSDAAVLMGIGTNNPSNKIHAFGDNPGVLVQDNGGLQCLLSAGDTAARIGTTSNHPINFISNNTNKMMVTPLGVGLGAGITSADITAINPLVIDSNARFVNRSNPSSYISFENTAQSRTYSLGVDSNGLLKITSTNKVDGTTAQIEMNSTGDVKINGSLSVKGAAATDPLAEVKVKYMGGSAPGYYATYAP